MVSDHEVAPLPPLLAARLASGGSPALTAACLSFVWPYTPERLAQVIEDVVARDV